MSKILATYDTETKQLLLEIDGMPQPGVQSVSMESYAYEGNSELENDGYFYANFKEMKNNGVKYSLSARASEIEKSDPVEDFAREVLTKTKKV